MGTTFRVVLYASSPACAEGAARAAFARVHALDAALSDYRETSELMRFSMRSEAGAPTEFVGLGADLWQVLERAQRFASESDGAFDVTAGPLIALWRRARRQHELPGDERIAHALEAVGWRKLELDSDSHSARLLVPNMRLDLGGIAKGYALDAALDVLAEHGVERALVDGGGDVAVRSAPPGERGWHVTLAPFRDPTSTLQLELVDAALATSGDLFQALELDGRRYSHIVDPRDGRALTTRVSASVVARDAASADALATTLCVLGPEHGQVWVQRFEGVEARIAWEGEEALETRATPGFSTRILPDAARPVSARAPSP